MMTRIVGFRPYLHTSSVHNLYRMGKSCKSRCSSRYSEALAIQIPSPGRPRLLLGFLFRAALTVRRVGDRDWTTVMITRFHQRPLQL